jgi:hypothetical protein
MADLARYSFCETLTAFVWHIRRLTDAGQKFGGGADTESLCGADVRWDLQAPVTEIAWRTGRRRRGGVCYLCWRKYKEKANVK